MSLMEIIFTALALSVDAFVCSLIAGRFPMSLVQRMVTGSSVALSFGFFQFFMPVLGFIAGNRLHDKVAAFDHWIAFVLLAGVSAQMLKEAWGKRDDEQDSDQNCSSESDRGRLMMIGINTLLAMAVATSLDALAVGVSYGLVSDSIMLPALIIGLICAVCSQCGFSMGQALSRLRSLDSLLNTIGALVLLGIGIKVLVEHDAFAQLTAIA